MVIVGMEKKGAGGKGRWKMRIREKEVKTGAKKFWNLPLPHV